MCFVTACNMALSVASYSQKEQKPWQIVGLHRCCHGYTAGTVGYWGGLQGVSEGSVRGKEKQILCANYSTDKKKQYDIVATKANPHS